MRMHLMSGRTGLLVLLCTVAAVAQAQDDLDHHAHAMPKAVPGDSMPFARLTDDGRLHLVYVNDEGGVKQVQYRQMFGDAPIESAISAPEEALAHWPESPPKVEVTRDGAIHVLYTVRVGAQDGEGTPVELRYTFSTDGGKTWSPRAVIGDPKAAVYRSCAAMKENAAGELVFSWLEGHSDSPAVGVRTAVRRGDAFEYATYDEKACECCATELLRGTDGTMWLGYRDVDEMNVRDMYVARMTADTAKFGPPTRISRDRWAVNGCPDTGPRFTLAPQDEVWAAWFSGNPRGVYAARAPMMSPKFTERELVQGMDANMTGIAHPTVGTLPDGRVLVAYQCTRDGDQHIEGRVRTGDSWSQAIRLGESGEYPRIAANGKQAYLVYTALSPEAKTIAVRDLSELIRTSN